MKVEELVLILHGLLSEDEQYKRNAVEERAKVLYELARALESGHIVELGTEKGYGAIALAVGAMDGAGGVVYTVDNYKPNPGWAGEVYPAENRKIFFDNLAFMDELGYPVSRHVVQIEADVMEAANRFMDDSVSLLYIDTGLPDITLLTAQAWDRCVKVGGIIAMRDTLTRSMKTDQASDYFTATGRYEATESPSRYFVMIKKVR